MTGPYLGQRGCIFCGGSLALWVAYLCGYIAGVSAIPGVWP